jgi:hypothetical protein
MTDPILLIIIGVETILIGLGIYWTWGAYLKLEREMFVVDCTLDVLQKLMISFGDKLHTQSHDLQQIKVRLHWSREREKKDLKQEKPKTKRFKGK